MPRLNTLLCLVCLFAIPAAQAESPAYPNKPVKIIVGFAAGGPTDTVARVTAQQLGQRLGQPVIVEVRAGAGGTIGAAYTAKSDPDGYTMYLASQTTNAVAPYMYDKPGYTMNDFTGVVRIVHNPLLMAVNPSFQVRTVPQLVAYAKANPGKINYGTGGVGSSPHMSIELLKKVAGIDMTPIHYKGDAAAVIDLMGGQVNMLTSSIAGILPYVRSGKLIPVAVTSSTRSPQLPDVPTIAESGYKGYEVITWFGLVAPAKTPPAIVARVNKEVLAALKVPEVKDQFTKMGFEVVPNSPEEFTQFIVQENTKWGSLVKSLGLHAN